MAKDDAGDMLMMFQKTAGGPGIEAEGQSIVSTKDKFTEDFAKDKFFEVDDFDLDIGLRENDPPDDGTSKGDTGKDKKNKARGIAPFSGMTQVASMPTQDALNKMFAVQMQEFSFSRRMDLSSPVMFQSCFNRVPWGQVTLVRRKVGGLEMGLDGTFQGSGKVASYAYLRIEFFEVLLTSAGYTGGGPEEVKEKYKFVCRKIEMKYRQQEHHGKLKPVISSTQLSLVQSQ